MHLDFTPGTWPLPHCLLCVCVHSLLEPSELVKKSRVNHEVGRPRNRFRRREEIADISDDWLSKVFTPQPSVGRALTEDMCKLTVWLAQ